MLITGQPTPDEIRSEDLHVAGEHHQVDLVAQHVELTLFCLHPNVLGGRHVQERHTERAGLRGEVGMVGDHHDHRHVQFTATIAPQQIQQAVVGLRRKDRHAFGHRSLREGEVHAERRGDLFAELVLQCRPCRCQSRQVKDRALHECSAGLLRRVLIKRHDIGPGMRQKRTDRRHQAGPIGAAQQQSANIGGRRKIAIRLRISLGDRQVGDVTITDRHRFPFPLGHAIGGAG